MLLFAGSVWSQSSTSSSPLEALEPARDCPAFGEFYSRAESISETDEETNDWAELEKALSLLLPLCLESSEYFALLGAAQLGALKNPQAIESLERALLLQPDNGGARIDYAQALYNVGQLFPAIEINEQVLSREDLPDRLFETLNSRQQNWRSETRQHRLQLDLAGGYDNNLNGAPNASQVTLTLSGEPVLLALSNEFQSTSGGYGNIYLGSRYQVRSSGDQHNWTNEVRGRLSGDQGSDLLQLESQYSYLRPRRSHKREANIGISHLVFGGSSLFSAVHAAARYELNGSRSCNPSVHLAAQRQHFPNRRQLDAFEAMASAGLSCDIRSGLLRAGSKVGLELGSINNEALSSGRPGGDRAGWQFSAHWQRSMYGGATLAHVSQTYLKDSRRYSAILADGANRWVRRSQWVVQHRRPLRIGKIGASLFFNVSHQVQGSNIELFDTKDTALEVGLGFIF